MSSKGYKHTDAAKSKISETHKGKKRPAFSKEWRENMSNARIGKRSNQWKGEKAGYSAKHKWIVSQNGNPLICENCEKVGGYIIMRNGVKRWVIQWANISGKYLRERSDWIGLCTPCHGKYDKKVTNYEYVT